MSILCESTAAEAANDRQMTENECRRKAEQKAANRRRRDDPHKGPHKSGPPHRGPHKAVNRRPQRDPHRKHTDIYAYIYHLVVEVEVQARRDFVRVNPIHKYI